MLTGPWIDSLKISSTPLLVSATNPFAIAGTKFNPTREAEFVRTDTIVIVDY